MTRYQGAAAIRASLSFTSLLARLLRLLGEVEVREEPESLYGWEPDIVFGEHNSLTPVEVKFYRRTSPPPVTTFVRALEYAENCRKAIGASRAILAISCPTSYRFEVAAELFAAIEIWDESMLFEMAAPFPELLAQFQELFEADMSKNLDLVSHGVPFSGSRDSLNAPPAPAPKRGKILADTLLAIEPGRTMAFDFEDACVDALKYLFEHDLHGWHEQSSTVDALHRRDLVCRIREKSAEVWRLMLEDLGSRYVVFEFKNYSKPITQNEIVTTERYLYPSALRKVAVVISHEDCADSAKAVIAGAMREHGKLIIPLSVPEIVDLLESKEKGSDPNSYLFERVDEFLLGLGR